MDNIYIYISFYSKGISEHKDSDNGGDLSKSSAREERLKGSVGVKGVGENIVQI